jgi:hypothetical protein
VGAEGKQVAGTKGRPAVGHLTEPVVRCKIGKSEGNRLLTAFVIKVDNPVLAPVAGTANDVYLLAADRQERVPDPSLCG